MGEPQLAAQARRLRKAHGCFYTPAPIARRLAELALGPLLAAGRKPRIVDPACGDGAFLEAARELSPAASLLGVDRDPAACALCRREGYEVLEADALLDELPGGFDALLANPPYLSVKRAPFSAAERAQLTARYRAARGQFDACALFVERALQLLRPGGRYALLLPRAVLANREHEPARRLLLEEGPPERVIDLGIAFEDAAVEVAGLVGARRARLSRPGKSVRLEDFEGRARGRITLAQWAALPGLRLPLRTSATALDLRARLGKSAPTLGQVTSRLQRGLELGRRDPRLAKRPAAGLRPLLRGRDVRAFHCEAPARFLDAGAVPTRILKELALYDVPEKLLVRRVADRLIAAVDRSGALALNTLYCVHPNAGVPADALACLINSSLATFWWRQSFAGDDRLFPYVRAAELPPLPIPARVASLAELGRRGATGNASQAEIDAAVEDLFGLNAEERRAVASYGR